MRPPTSFCETRASSQCPQACCWGTRVEVLQQAHNSFGFLAGAAALVAEAEGMKRKLGNKLGPPPDSGLPEPSWQVSMGAGWLRWWRLHFTLGRTRSRLPSTHSLAGFLHLPAIPAALSSIAKAACWAPPSCLLGCKGLCWVQVAECAGIWWRPNFDNHLYPYCPTHIAKPKVQLGSSGHTSGASAKGSRVSCI